MAVKSVLNYGTVAVFCQDTDKARYLISQISRQLGVKLNKFVAKDAVEYKFENYGTLWVVGNDCEKLPFTQVDALYSADSHSRKADPRAKFNLEALKTVYLGNFAHRSHWFYQLARKKCELYRFTAKEVCEAFPDQEKYRTNDERSMGLVDVESMYSSPCFSHFARHRVHIRTDRPLDKLSLRQREEAKLLYGDAKIIIFESSRLQKKYLAQKRMAVMKGKKPFYILLKYRRGGFTTTEQGQSYQCAVEKPNSQVVTFADADLKTRRIFRMVNIMHENDPKKLKLVSDSTRQMEWDNGSVFFVGTAGSKSFARGDTLQRAHWSETAWSMPGPNQEEDAAALIAGVVGACENGEIVFESTPAGRNFFFNLYMDAKNGNSQFTPVFLRWFDDPLNRKSPGTFDPEEILETLSEEETRVMQRYGLDLSQIAFRREKKMTFKALFPQEYPEDDMTCFITSGLCFFSLEMLQRRRDDLLENQEPSSDTTMKWWQMIEDAPEVKEVPGGYIFTKEEPIEGVDYALGADTSEGIPGCDPAGWGIIRKDTGEQVSWGHGMFRPELLGTHLVEQSLRYNKALIGIERNNHGHSVIQRVKILGADVPHYKGGTLYFHGHKPKNANARNHKPSDARAGWDTNSQTRPMMLDNLNKFMEAAPDMIHDLDFVDECFAFNLQTNGRWEADSGAHDDRVMKWAIAYEMRGVKNNMPGWGFA